MAGNVFAATEVGGSIAVDTIWPAAGSPYVVGETISIVGGATLSVEAGTTIYMNAGTSLVVQTGGLLIKGVPTAPVRITSQKIQAGQAALPGDWGQIKFAAGTVSAKTRIENAVLEFGRGVVLEGASPTFNFVAINNHNAPAITIDLASSPAGAGNSATGNQLNGILVPPGALQNNVVWGVRGIPFVLAQGRLSVGVEPTLNSLLPNSLEQGEQASLALSGGRLRGLDKLRFEPAISDATILAGGTDTAATVVVRVPTNMPAGAVSLSAITDAGEVVLPNALSITAMRAPTITGVTPKTVAHNAETTVLLNGSSLGATTVSSATSGLRISGITTTRTSLSFRVNVDSQVVPGIYPFQVSNAAGAAAFSLEVIPDITPPPPFEVVPTIVTLSPDSIYRNVLFHSAQSATADRTYALVVEDPTVARLRSANLTLPAGQVSASLAVAGLKLGTTVLRISGDGLAMPLEVPISVVAGGYQQTSVSPAIGVVRGEQFTGGGTNRVLISNPVGVVVGNGNTTNVANYKVVGSPVGLVKGNLYGGASFVVSPVIGIQRQ